MIWVVNRRVPSSETVISEGTGHRANGTPFDSAVSAIPGPDLRTRASASRFRGGSCVTIEAQIEGLREFDLTKYRDGGNAESDRKRELPRDQRRAQCAGASRYRGRRLQRHSGPQTGENDRRIKPTQQAEENGAADHHRQLPPVGKVAQVNGLAQEPAVLGERHFHEGQCNAEGDEHDQDGLRQNLCTELRPLRSCQPAQRDLSGAQLRARGREIDEVAACDEQNEQSDDRKALYESEASAGRHPDVPVALQMRFPERSEPVALHLTARDPEARLAEVDGSIQDRLQSAQYRRWASARLQLDIAIVVIARHPIPRLVRG